MDFGTLIRGALLVSTVCGVMLSPAGLQAATFPEFVDPNPAPGNQFGHSVVPLSTGNVVITSPNDDAGGSDAGAVYLFNGSTGALISTLRGSRNSDRVGNGGVTALSNGNYVVRSPNWSGDLFEAGAATWGNGTTGVSGVVSAANSLVGTFRDRVGNGGVTALSNGNYVVISPNWGNVADFFAPNAGAVTWGSGTTGVSGVVSDANSLVGWTSNDQVGNGGVTALSNGNYVVVSPNFDGGSFEFIDKGAVTWGSGTTGVSGPVLGFNSLVGSFSDDRVGNGGVTALSNGNYVVRSPNWDNDKGAVTWGSGTFGVTGEVSADNSLVGSQSSDQVGTEVTALSNGNYVVRSTVWDNGAITNAGAATWGRGTSGFPHGVISAANSLVGSTAYNTVGSGGVTALTNGNYVVSSPNSDNGAATDAGAVTWGSGTAGVSGVVSAANSLVGSTDGDEVGTSNSGVTALSNGNYVVTSVLWDNGAATEAGAVTWGSGSMGVIGVVSAANSLVGSTAGDIVGDGGVTALTNGNYVVRSPAWINGAATGAGAATWGSGTTGVIGVVSAANSLVGSAANDEVGNRGVTALSNGNYVVASWLWNTSGAATWGSGTTGVSGVVSAANSLVGSTASDFVGTEVTPLSNGNYVVRSPNWSNGAIANAGAATWGSGTNGVTGVISAANSLVGSTANNTVGSGGVTALTNGNYVVVSPNWDSGAATDAGAATWGSGTIGVTGAVSAANSLVGSTTSDFVGSAGGNNGVTALSNGNYVVASSLWNNGAAADAGAASWGRGTTGVTGVVSTVNSLVGSTANTSLQPIVADDVYSNFFGRFLHEAGGRVRVGPIEGMTAVGDGRPTALALEGVWPNPAGGNGLHVAFVLPTGTAARLELLDVSGRRVLAREVGSLGAGRHTLNLAEARGVAPGLYWVRLTQGPNRWGSRVVVTH